MYCCKHIMWAIAFSKTRLLAMVGHSEAVRTISVSLQGHSGYYAFNFPWKCLLGVILPTWVSARPQGSRIQTRIYNTWLEIWGKIATRYRLILISLESKHRVRLHFRLIVGILSPLTSRLKLIVSDTEIGLSSE